MEIRYTFYDVCNGNKPVLVEARRKEVCEFLGIKSFDYSSYCKDGKLCRGKYEVIKKVDGEVQESPTTFSDDFRREWEKECEWYRNFDWRKTWSKGVKRLVPGIQR